MTNAILLHGKPDKDEYDDPNHPSASNDHWFPWLQKQLTMCGINTQTPEMPNAWQPYYPDWQKEFERYDITPETTFVGHSCGAGFIVRWLSEHPDAQVGRVVLVAPSLGKDWPQELREFFDFTMDPNLAARTQKLTVFESDNDGPGIQEAYEIYRTTLKGVEFKDFHGYGHFCAFDTGRTDFPELLAALVEGQ